MKLRLGRIAAVALISAGAVILTDVAITLAWQEPVSSIYASVRQGEAEDDVGSLNATFPEAIGRTDDQIRRRARRLAGEFESEIKQGQGIGKIRIPAIDVENSLIEGVGLDELEQGPGRYASAAMPGQGETVAIAGHRTTFLAPFRHIDDLENGDEVFVEMPYATFAYEVERARVVDPTALEVVKPIGQERLVLTACHPLHSAAQRYVVFADLADITTPGSTPPS